MLLTSALCLASASALVPVSPITAARTRTPLEPLNAVAAGEVPDMNKRVLMNWILVGSAATTVAALGLPYVYFFYPRVSGGGGGVIAADANGDAVITSKWLASHPAGSSPELVQGLKGDATYLLV